MSAPSAINAEYTSVKMEDEATGSEWGRKQHQEDTMRSEDSVLIQSVDLGSPGHEAWRSLSCFTDSTEQSAPVNFDMSNRVQLAFVIFQNQHF